MIQIVRTRAPKRRVLGPGKRNKHYEMGNSMVGVDEFMKMDKDMQKYVFLAGNVHNQEVREVKINNEEKIGYYYITKSIKNAANNFYVKSTLHQWIVYKKKSKKVKISTFYDTVFPRFMKDYYYESDRQLLMKFVTRPTPTFCKKVFEGKMTSIKEAVSYHRSYVLRNKNTDIRGIFNMMALGHLSLLRVIEDPESLEDWRKLEEYRIIPAVTEGRTVSCKLDEIATLNNKHNEWIDRESKRYDTFLRQRDGIVGDPVGEGATIEISSASY